MNSPCLLEVLRGVPDPRSRRGCSYPFHSILALLVVGILVGRRSPAAIAQMAEDYGPQFALLLGFPRMRIPTPSAISKLLPRINVAALEAVLTNWITSGFSPANESPPSDANRPDPLVVAIDGKRLRGSAQPVANLPGVHLLAAFAPRVQAVLAQLRVEATTNEHKAALELLNILPKRAGGYIFTGDAMFTQTDVCQAIRTRGDDYVLVVKDNQKALAVDIEAGLTFAATAATFSPRGPRSSPRANARTAVCKEHRKGPRSRRTSGAGKYHDLDRSSGLAGSQARLSGASLGNSRG